MHQRGGLATMLATGRVHGTNALLAEVSYRAGDKVLFARWDDVQKLSVGGVQKGIGAVDFYRYPASLKPAYRSAPVSVTVFYRWRWGDSNRE
jgi:hypothetical protein